LGPTRPSTPARHRIFDLLLDRTLERPRTVNRIEARLRDFHQRRLAHGEHHVLRREPLSTVATGFWAIARMSLVERMEHDDLVDTVDELGPEALATSAITASLIRP